VYIGVDAWGHYEVAGTLQRHFFRRKDRRRIEDRNYHLIEVEREYKNLSENSSCKKPSTLKKHP
jgi:hypothetical protein